MDFTSVLAQINRLPLTYLRPGNTFAAMQAAKAAALMRYAAASDALVNQLTFSQATGVWLDVWGKLFGIPRNPQESDDSYLTRISGTLVAGRTTPVAMAIYLNVALGIDGSIVEDLVNTAWKLQFSSPITGAQYNQIMTNMAFVRPAGVPSTAFVGATGGLYSGTVNYTGAPRVTGAYLEESAQNYLLDISAYTNNSNPLLPTLFMSDPTINPGPA